MNRIGLYYCPQCGRTKYFSETTTTKDKIHCVDCYMAIIFDMIKEEHRAEFITSIILKPITFEMMNKK